MPDPATPDPATSDPATPDPTALRAAMLAAVQQGRFASRPEVAAVMGRVPRHEFVPEADLDAAYNPWFAVITHRFADGRSLSCASAPFVVAMMLDQLAVEPGHRILEIGAGTGYNASLLADLTGDDSLVTTIDIDPEVTEQARRNLAAAGHPGVHVVTGDGTHGVPEHAPYDRLIATVSPWDIPTAWWDQLAPDARVVAPLRWRGQARSVALAHDQPRRRLIADSMHLCGFVYLTGESDGERSAPITHPDSEHFVALHWDRDQPIDPAALSGVLDQPATTTWSGGTVAADEPHDGLWLRLTVTDPRVCRINAAPDTPPTLCAPIAPLRSPALAERASLAYLTSRRDEDTGRWEIGAIGHGPEGPDLADALTEHTRQWSTHRDVQPALHLRRDATLAPTDTVIPKNHGHALVLRLDFH